MLFRWLQFPKQQDIRSRYILLTGMTGIMTGI